ncbi:MAG: DNA polymerase III subunit gamma/tau, partial [Candidatus Eisenbacteria bacterium]|nr:DNA polymerase III subunit gamma/tau [Candidatus Eisenbacteria bacterium]
KYRPQVFTDVVGQDHVSRVLARAVESGRIAHAFLFTGARGVGKTTSARILAKSLNCRERLSGERKGPDPCNRCTSCLEITSGAALDVTEIDGASNRGIADVQALRERVRFTPTGGGYRVVIIDEVHQLSNDAFAALLKTLEEPPPHLVFVFATTDPQKLPDTIRSRTQRFDFARVPLRKVADRVLAITEREKADPEGLRFTLTEDAALLIAHKSEGSMRDAVSALDQVISAGESAIDAELVRRVLGLADREVFFALAGAIVTRDAKSALAALHQAFDKGLDARELAEGLAEHVRHLLILKVDSEGADLVAASREEIARMRAQAADWSEGDLLRLLRIASDVQWPLRESPQPLIHLEAAVVQMATLERGETLAELIGRLEALEQRMSGGTAAPTTRGGVPAGGTLRGPSSGSAPQSEGTSRGSAPQAAAGGSPPRRSSGGPVAFAVGESAAIAAPAPDSIGTAIAEASPETEGDAGEAWKRAIEAVGRRKRMLGAFFEACALAGVSDGRIVLVMDDLHRAVIEEKENRAIATEEIAKAFGRALVLECVAPGEGAAAPARAPDLHPMIEKAIRWFEGDIIERRDRGTERKGG